jgi:hypothetical protein
MTKTIVPCAVLVTSLFASPFLCGEAFHPVKYYVQLVWGTDREKPADAPFKPAGPRLTKQLTRVFRWAHYWEVKRAELRITSRKPVRIRLSNECEIDMAVIGSGQRETRLYGKGVLVQKILEPIHREEPSIHGGPTEVGGAWFVVVREDEPTYGQIALSLPN